MTLKKTEIMESLLAGNYKEAFVLKVLNKIHAEEIELHEYTEIIQELESGKNYTGSKLEGVLEKSDKEHTASVVKEKSVSEIIEEHYESCARTLTELSKNPANLVKYVNFINCITESISKSKETLPTSLSRGFL